MSKKFIPNDNNNAIAYYRYSSHAQNDASIEQQQEVARKYAAEKGYTIVKEYADRAVSGTTDDRPQLQLMLAEVKSLRPAVLLVWKTDRLGRNRTDLAFIKYKIKDAGCKINYLAETIPENEADASLIEGMYEVFAEYYSKQLSQNIKRGLNHNSELCLFNGHRTFGYKPEEGAKCGKRIEIDNESAPIVRKIFADYAAGTPLKKLADELNGNGLRTIKGNEFTINSLRNILQNETYTGRYKYGDTVVPDGIPALVSKEQFDAVQRRMALNKRLGSSRKISNDSRDDHDDNSDAPHYWLTGKLFCGYCGKSMQGVSGTSKTGAKHYYYYCSSKRRNKCRKKHVKKHIIEGLVLVALKSYLNDSEQLTSLAADAAAYYEEYNMDTGYLDSLQGELKTTENALNNLVKALEHGIFSESTMQRLTELETNKRALQEAIDLEQAKKQLKENKHDIAAYFREYANANLDDPMVRDSILDYFVDKIYVYDDHIEITGYFLSNKNLVDIITWEEYKGAVEFDHFADSSTMQETTFVYHDEGGFLLHYR